MISTFRRSIRRHRKVSWSNSELERRLMLAADCGAVANVVGDTAADSAPATVIESARVMCEEIVFIDGGVSDFDELSEGVLANAEIVLLDSSRGGIEQVTEILSQHRNVKTVHLVTHGAAGRIQLGNQQLDAKELNHHADQLQQWARSFGNDADILLYGCETGRGVAGSMLLQQLANLTGADVAASTNVTGHADHNGDWILEKHVGTIEASLVFDAATLARYQSHLPVTIAAAGAEGDETMHLTIDGAIVQTWTNVGGDAYARQFETFTYNADGINPGQIGIAFTNAIYDPIAGIDRNLRVDNITVDGVIYETEDPSVYSTGTWRPGIGVVPGFPESEMLHANGMFQFADTGADGSLISIAARGDMGQESMSLLIDGEVVRSWSNVETTTMDYTFQADATVDASQVRVAFTNASYDPANGIDRNLVVDNIAIDGTVHETEAPTVYSTGTWQPGIGVTPGFKQSEILHSNGYFQYDAAPANPGSIGLAGTQYTVDEDQGTVQIEISRSGGSDGIASAFFQTVGVEATDGQDFVGTDAGQVDFADGQTTAFAVIDLIDDEELESIETFSLSLFGTTGAALGVPRTAIVTIVDDESGPDLVGHWRLDETTIGETVIDSSGLGNDGTHTNISLPDGPATDTPNVDSPNPYSLFFDGVDDYVSIANAPSLDLSGGSFTQSVWVKPTSTNNGYHPIIGFEDAGGKVNRYPGIWVIEQNKIYAGFGDGTKWTSFSTDEVLTVGAWNHVATTFDGTNLNAYVNGVQVYTSTKAAGLMPVASSQVDIGKVNNGFYKGGIDDVRIYNRALSASEIGVLIDGADVPPIAVDGLFQLNTLVSGFNTPTSLDWLPDGRMMVAEQDGLVRLVNIDNTIRVLPVLDIADIVNSGAEDRGILGFAIHPDFDNNPYIYVSYTYDPPEVYDHSGLGGPDGDGGRVARISRYTVDPVTMVADPANGFVLIGNNSTYENAGSPNIRPDLGDPHSCFDENGNPIEDCIPSDETSHTIGDLEFGPDGMLYASTGDGGSFGRADPVNMRSLDVDSLAGKILRFDPITGEGLADNPFYDGDVNTNESKVYSYGLRNPFRIAINQDTGEVYAGDVGWTQWEEINSGRGANFGWPAFEGGGNGINLQTERYEDLPEVQAYYATNPDVTPPIWAKLHSDGARAIIMGDFVSESLYPAQYEDALLITDIGDQTLRMVIFDENGDVSDVEKVSNGGTGFVVDFKMHSDGYMYYVNIFGSIGRLDFVVA